MTEKTLEQVARDIQRWTSKNFPGTTRVVAALGLAEETGEVCRAVLKQEQGIRGSYEDWDAEIKKELGDVFIKIIDVAGQCGFDPISLILDRWSEIEQRDWTRNPQGHGI